jgi:ABC-type Fe3+ transport system substrate-binding protein
MRPQQVGELAMSPQHKLMPTEEMIEAGVEAAEKQFWENISSHDVKAIYLAMEAARPTTDVSTDVLVERIVRDLAKQLYAHHVVKYDPEAEEYCIRQAIAALQRSNAEKDEALKLALELIECIEDEEGYSPSVSVPAAAIRKALSHSSEQSK